MADTVKAGKTSSKIKPPPLVRGARLGKYRLQKRLGKGGYCEVWKARDCIEGIWVALKIPLDDTDGQRDNQTLLREIRLVAHLNHPHILPLKNADIIAGYVVLATDLSAGTLDDCSKPMSVRKIITITGQVLDALAYAHSHRLVHCDVTPGNIFLFPDGHAALGDFGISLQFKDKMATVDEFGTPGYVAPEQAYGHPTYHSDCFAIALILYEYLSGFLPRWPFNWPPRGLKRLQERTGPAFARFMKQALSVDPSKRFANAKKMLTALRHATPKTLQYGVAQELASQKKKNWLQMRREAFIKRYRKIFPIVFRCIKCGEPIAENMPFCPWCGTDSNCFDRRSQFNHICPSCHKGILTEWRFCPWCYGTGFASPSSTKTTGIYYHNRCKYCRGKIMRFMKYCPWCHRKVRQPWQIHPFPEICTRCGWSIDSTFWNYCPWCRSSLNP